MMKSKDEVYKILKKSVSSTTFTKKTGRKVKRLRTYNEGEYTCVPLQEFCEKTGIARHFTVRNTPQQNGIAERMNWTVL